MRYLALLTITAIILTSCSKKNSPEGPSDIRIKNLSTLAFDEVTVDTSGGKNEYETVPPGEYSSYKRFDKAYPKAEITAVINGQIYSTGPQNYNYQVVLGQGKFTYEVYISDPTNRVLTISKVIPEAPLD